MAGSRQLSTCARSTRAGAHACAQRELPRSTAGHPRPYDFRSRSHNENGTAAQPPRACAASMCTAAARSALLLYHIMFTRSGNNFVSRSLGVSADDVLCVLCFRFEGSCGLDEGGGDGCQHLASRRPTRCSGGFTFASVFSGYVLLLCFVMVSCAFAYITA